MTTKTKKLERKKNVKSKKAKASKKAEKKEQSATQKLIAKIAKKHRQKADKARSEEKPEIKIDKPAPKKLKTIPEELRIAVKLTFNEYAQVDFSHFRFRDLQKACIIRGMPPEDLVKGAIYDLHKFISDNQDKEVDVELLDKFDEWREKVLEEKHGKGEPFVKLGYIGKTDEEGNPVMVFKAKPKKPKKHIEKDSEMGGLWKGTKKHLTVQCKQEGLSLEETFAKVKEIFPDAKESSMKIWHKKG